MKKILLIIFFIYIPYNCLANQLITATEHNAINQVHALLKSGIDPDLPGKNNVTALMKSSLLNNIEITNLLLKYQANPNKTDLAKTSALHLAARKGNNEIIAILINANANINIQDFSGYTPLMRAVSSHHYYAIKTLLEHKAHLFIKNNNSQNVFDIVISANKPQSLYLLIEQLSYNNLTYLKTLHKKAINDNNRQMSNIIEKRIADIENIKSANDARVSFSSKLLKEQIATKPLNNFPCLNDDIKNITIKNNICINSSTEILITLIPQRKSKTFLPTTHKLSAQHIKNIINTAQTKPLSWKSEFIIPISKGQKITTPENPVIYTIPVFKPENMAKPVPIQKPNLNDPLNLTIPLIAKPATNLNNNTAKKTIASPIIPISKPNIKWQNNNSKKTSMTTQPANLQYQHIARYVRVSNIRTNEWSINPNKVPISLIDYEILGPDLLFNRKYSIPAQNASVPKPKKQKPTVKIKKNLNKGIFIQIGIYANFNNARNIAKKAKKYGNTFFSEGKIKRKKVLKVLVGPFPSFKTAKEIQAKKSFKQLFGKKTIIRKL